MQMCPLRGSRFQKRQRYCRASSSGVGEAIGITSKPLGSSGRAMRRMLPPLPAASQPS